MDSGVNVGEAAVLAEAMLAVGDGVEWGLVFFLTDGTSLHKAIHHA